MKIQSIQELTLPELVNRLNEARQEQFNLRFQQATRQLKNYRRLTEVRRDIARISMLIGERERQAREQG
ncbi:MAG: 50S ribosomal protein L29 [Chloroflexi bacterium]|nr:50S ribosomal protein L29 [Chloroflexota bacterium]